MFRKLCFSLPCLLLAACADTSEKYRDTHHLEIPPILAIEHTNSAPVEAETVSESTAKKKSILEGIEQLTEKDGKPIMQINTRLDRAWELVETALQLANIEVLDKNRNELSLLVNYDPDGHALVNMFNNQYDAEDYTISVKEAITGIEVSAKLAKPAANDENQENNSDGSAELIKRLHQVLQEKIINRENKDRSGS